MKKYKLKKEVKTIIILMFLLVMVLLFVEVADQRRKEIENNPEAFKNRSIEINFTR